MVMRANAVGCVRMNRNGARKACRRVRGCGGFGVSLDIIETVPVHVERATVAVVVSGAVYPRAWGSTMIFTVLM
jgi:hypothetical protein